MLTADRVREVLHYCPDTGVFTRLEGRKAGCEAGTIASVGYRYISVDGKLYPAGRLAWLYVTGAWPAVTIDHKNGVSTDERWCNLREATYSEQNINRRVRSDSGTGLKGVQRTGKGYWMARVKRDGKRIYLGCFKTPEEAHAAYVAAAPAVHGEFARTA